MLVVAGAIGAFGDIAAVSVAAAATTAVDSETRFGCFSDSGAYTCTQRREPHK